MTDTKLPSCPICDKPVIEIDNHNGFDFFVHEKAKDGHWTVFCRVPERMSQLSKPIKAILKRAKDEVNKHGKQ